MEIQFQCYLMIRKGKAEKIILKILKHKENNI